MAQQSHEIVVYPSRARLVRYLLLQLAILALIVAIIPISAGEKAQDPRALVVVILIPWLGLLTLLTAYRAIVRKPAVIVNKAGITDNCSLIAGGIGLIRWREIKSLYPYVYKASQQSIKAHRPYLVIVPVDARAILVRHGPLTRMLRRLVVFTLPTWIALPGWMLSSPVDELLSEVRTGYHAQLQAHHIDLTTVDLDTWVKRKLASIHRQGNRVRRG